METSNDFILQGLAKLEDDRFGRLPAQSQKLQKWALMVASDSPDADVDPVLAWNLKGSLSLPLQLGDPFKEFFAATGAGEQAHRGSQ